MARVMMKLLLLFLFFILILFISETSSFITCGNRPFYTEVKASYSTELNPVEGKWPWIVSIQKKVELGYKHICAGTILNNEWIITAAHCFKDWKEGDPTTPLRVLLGTFYLSEIGLRTQSRGVKQLIKHDQYDPITESNDIALIQLDKQVEFSDHIQQACFPKESADLKDLIDCSIAGWGAQGKHLDEPSQFLQEAQVERIDTKHCNKWYQGILGENHLCAGHRKGPEKTCNGDRGSPLMCRTKKNNVYSVIGILNWGSGCGQTRSPGVYSPIQSHIKWIVEKVKNEAVKATIQGKRLVPKLLFPLVKPDHMNPNRNTAQNSEAEIKETENTGQQSTPVPPMSPAELNSAYKAQTAENISRRNVLKRLLAAAAKLFK
ncbi:hypothetical protein XENTR_v10005149 [Xenopus tropicalis]|nr:hypothetical protein XENTR_v10005149 [Xenopus tropicalis]